MSDIPIIIKKNRLAFIDVLRGIACIWMIETHVVNVFLDSAFKQNWLFNQINMSNGFVAVSFIFCAGAGFFIAAERKIDEFKRFSPSLFVYLRRLLFILGLAYWMNLPAFSLFRTMNASNDEFLKLFECDVLHTIVFSSFLALFIALINPKQALNKWIALSFALGIFFLSPFIANTDPLQAMPMPIAMLFEHYPISKFPIFPFAGYFFAGMAFTGFWMHSRNQSKFVKIAAICAIILPQIVFIIKELPFQYPGWQEWWYCSPGHSIFRVCAPIFFFCILYLIENKLQKSRIADILRLSGQESLFFYISHLMLVYGSVANIGLKYFIVERGTPLQTILVFLVITTAVYFTAMMWHNTKSQTPIMAQRIIIALVLLFFVVFAFVPDYRLG